MSKFIKFSNRIVNTAFIKYVNIEPNKYTLHLASNDFTGSVLFGSGSIGSHDNLVYATKTDHPESYATIEKWIQSIECVSKN